MQYPQPRAKIVDADARVCRLPIRGKLRTVIVHAQSEFAVPAHAVNADNSAGRALRDAVLDGVFDKRLQQQLGTWARSNSAGMCTLA